MTTEALGCTITSAANGVTTVFSVPFQVRSSAELKVYLLTAADQDSADGTLLAEGADYSISGDLTAHTANITTTIAHPGGKFIRRERVTSRAQAADYIPGDGFPANSHEAQLDRLSLVDEEQDAKIAAVEAGVAAVETDVDGIQQQLEDLDQPNFTFEVATGAPGTNASLDVTGTFPDLHFAFTLPRGSQGGGGLGDGDFGDFTVSGGGTLASLDPNVVTMAKLVAAASAGFIGATGAGDYAHRTISQVKTDLSLNNVDNSSDANKPVSTATATALAGKAPLRATIGSFSADKAAADADHNKHFVASGAAKTLTLGSITAGTAFTVRFTTAWSIACAGGLSKNGADPSGVTTGNVAANSLITFLHEGAGVWVATGSGLS